MTKRARHAKKPAASQPEAVRDDQPAAGAQQEAPALVAGDGAGGDPGPQDAGGAPGAHDGADQQEGLAVSTVQGGGPAHVPVQDRQPEADGSARHDHAVTDPDGNPASDDAPAEVSRWHELYHNDPNFWPAILAVEKVAGQALRIVDADAGKALSEIALEHDALTGQSFAIAADMLREIGHVRATVDVVASQLVLKGQRADKTLTGVERVVLECFLFTLASLDGFAKAEADRKAREQEEANRKAAPPVPIEETTLETVDGPMDTWRV